MRPTEWRARPGGRGAGRSQARAANGITAGSQSAAATTYRFPKGFLWGAATSSHQVEGGNRWNDWWEFERAGRVPFRSGEACRHFALYEADFELARSLGHNAHRFSIEWSRIEPREGEWNREALAHYAEVVRALRARGMEPVLTLHHFTNPAWFARAGGWRRRESVESFTRYVAFVAENLDADVRYWLTVNEPTVYVKRAYVSGDWPPGRRGDWTGAARTLRHMCRAHVAAYGILRDRRPEAQVGFAHSAPHVVACDPHRALDRLAAGARDLVLNGSWFRLMAARRRPFDFIGLNYYTRTVVRWRPRRPLFGVECREDHHGTPRRFSAMGWEIHPPGLTDTLARFARHGVPLMVTENGIATDDEDLRAAYLLDHLRALADAIKLGAPVIGYFYWTLMDNFEWDEGVRPRFGLASVDFATQQRHVRPAARLYADVCRTNRLTVA